MLISIPDFAYEPLMSFSACGVIKDVNAPIPENDENLEARTIISGDVVWVRLLANKQTTPEGLHFHVDFARESTFDKVPTETATIDKLLSRIGELSGFVIGIRARGRFEIPADDIPKDNVVSLLLSVTVGADPHVAQLTGAKFSFDDGPVDSVTWSKKETDDGERILATLRGWADTSVSERYLIECLEPLKNTFSNLMIGE